MLAELEELEKRVDNSVSERVCDPTLKLAAMLRALGWGNLSL